MTTVWMVTTGSYSDFQVRAICSSVELATEIANRFSDANEVEEWEIDREMPVFYDWFAQIDVDTGDLLYEPWRQEGAREIERHLYLRSTADGIRYTPGAIRVNGTDCESAIKNAADYRRQLLAGQASAEDVARYAGWIKRPKKPESDT